MMQRSDKDLASIRHIEISLNAICERHKWTMDCLGCPFCDKNYGACIKRQINLLLAVARGDELHIGELRLDSPLYNPEEQPITSYESEEENEENHEEK